MEKNRGLEEYRNKNEECEKRLEAMRYELQRSRALALFHREKALLYRKRLEMWPEGSEWNAPSISTDDASESCPSLTRVMTAMYVREDADTDGGEDWFSAEVGQHEPPALPLIQEVLEKPPLPPPSSSPQHSPEKEEELPASASEAGTTTSAVFRKPPPAPSRGGAWPERTRQEKMSAPSESETERRKQTK